jgi:4-amino-4-deoxychorismate lyase
MLTPLLFETIKIENGQIANIEWHNQRCNRSRFDFFQERKSINLETFITAPKSGLYRCRIVYNKHIQSVEYIPYIPIKIEHIKLVNSQIDYSYKYNNREIFHQLQQKGYDEILIEKNGLLTDTSIANIAFYTGKEWITPKIPLLEGTLRARLLNENFLKLKNIEKNEIKNFSHFALMNAMIGFQIQKSVNIRI